MDRRQEGSRQDPSYLSLGVDELQEKVQDKPTKISVFEAGGEDEGKMKFVPEEGAAAAEGCYAGFGASSPVNDDKNQKGGYGGDDKPKLPPPKEPGLEAAANFEDEEHDILCSQFSRLQLRELERVFQRTQFPDVFAGKDLEIPMSVTGGKVELNKPENTNLPRKPF